MTYLNAIKDILFSIADFLWSTYNPLFYVTAVFIVGIIVLGTLSYLIRRL